MYRSLFAAGLLVLSFLIADEHPFSRSSPTSPTSPMHDAAFHGLRTVIYQVDDLDEAKRWYTRMLDAEPYFDEPFYVGYDVGGYELGLMPDPVPEGRGGIVAYWGVDDADAALQRLIDRGATPHEAVQEVGEGIRTATVRDPFGNVFGIIENPHFEAEE